VVAITDKIYITDFVEINGWELDILLGCTINIHPTFTDVLTPRQEVTIKVSIATLTTNDVVDWHGTYTQIALTTNLEALSYLLKVKQVMWCMAERIDECRYPFATACIIKMQA
jgi:uncharacterized Fe-S cluster-containing radical SAM superfamily protein